MTNMRNRILLIGTLVGTLIGVAFTGTASAQQTTGAIQGTVKDKASGKALEGVTVVATSASLQGSQSETTDEDGLYFLSSLPTGAYEVVFYYSDTKVRRTNVIVAVGATTPVHASIDTVAAGGQEIVIEQRTPTIDTSGTKQGISITSDYTRNVPSRGRSYEGVIGAAPGAQGDDLGIAFSGSGSVENSYLVDGINTTGIAYADGGSPLLNDFIQEIEVITGGYNAEFGRSTGGVVNVVTKTGSNEFHGSVFANSRPLEAARDDVFVVGSSIDANSALRYDVDFGFELGGPIVKDKVWFYVGFSPVLGSSRIDRIISTRVDRRFNDRQYVDADGDGRLDDGDGNPATDPNSLCELAGNCESDGQGDIDAETGFEIFEEVERQSFNSTGATYVFLGKVNFAVNPDHQGQLSVFGSPARGKSFGVTGTPTATQLDFASNVYDGSFKWTSKFLDNKLELEALLGAHRSDGKAQSVNKESRDLPRIAAQRASLGQIGRNPDAPESDSVLQFCTDGDPSVTDDFGAITNCPVFGYSFNSLGGFDDSAEKRNSAKVDLTYRLKLAGHHKLKVGADLEDNFFDDFGGVSSGKSFTLNGSQRNWRVFQYARAGDENGNCGIDDAGNPIPCPDTCFDDIHGPGRAELPCDTLEQFERSTNTFNWSAYVQDSWQILPNLTVNAGLRYEQQRLKAADQIQDTVDPITNEAIGEDALVLDDLFAPRIGALYDWTKEGRSKIYANWGRFYESVPMDINNRAFGGEAFYEAFYDARVGGDSGCQPFAMETDPNRQTGLPSDPRTCDLATEPAFAYFIGAGNPALAIPPGMALIVPDLSAQYLDEVVAGVEYELLEDLRVGLSYQNRQLGRVIEDVSTDGAVTYMIANPGDFSASSEDALLKEIESFTAAGDMAAATALSARLDMFRKVRDFDRPRRDYQAIQLTTMKRFSKSFFLQGSFTYSHLEGNYPGLYAPDNGQLDPNITSQYDLIELLGNRDGKLPGHKPFNFKLDGYYTFDLGAAGELTTGGRLRAISGEPIDTLGSHPAYGARESFVLPRGTFGTTAFQTGADLRLQYTRDLGKQLRLSLYFDLYNVANQQIELDVDEQYTIADVNPIIGGTKEDLFYLKATDGGFETNQIAQKELNYANTTSRLSPLSGRFGLRLEF